MKKIIAVLGLLLMVGCGDNVPPRDSGGGDVEVVQSALTAISYPQIYLNHTWMQQVPAACQPTFCSGPVGAYDVVDIPNGYNVYGLPDGAIGGVTGTPGGVWNVTVRGVTSPDIRVVAHAAMLNWSVNYTNTASNYFPRRWNLPGGRINFGVTGSSGELVTNASNYWSQYGTVYAYWWNGSGGIGGNGPDASTTYMAVRVDVPSGDFVYRWFYWFTK